MKSRLLCLFPLLLLTAHAGTDLTLWYRTPAAKGMNEGLPVGNGRMGGLILGGVEREVVQFNEISLWTGTEISSDDYSKMGAYQKFGDLIVEMSGGAGPSSSPAVSCTSGHKAFFDHETIAAAGDGDLATKWCVEHDGRPVVWEMRLPEARAVNRYTLTSGNDTPARDPSTWEFVGSNDGRQWVVLDRHEQEPPFAQRGEKKTFLLAGEAANKPFKVFRLTFQPGSMKHFQIAEIALPGISAAAAATPVAAAD